MMRARAILSPLRPFVVGAAALALAFAGAGAGCSSGSSSSGSGSGGGGGAAAPCYDYASFDGATPVETFQADVLPILRASCGLSTSCHGTTPTNGDDSTCAASYWAPPTDMQQYYGPALSCGAPTMAEIDLIFSNAVGVKSIEETDMDVIAPGDPEHSYLMYKIDDTLTCPTLKCSQTMGACYSSMPQTGSTIALSERDIIRRWIAQGAKND